MSEDDHRLIRIETKLDDIVEKQGKMATDIALLKDRPVCPSPGLCEKLEPIVSTLNDERKERMGQWKLVIGVSTVVSCLVGLLVEYARH